MVRVRKSDNLLVFGESLFYGQNEPRQACAGCIQIPFRRTVSTGELKKATDQGKEFKNELDHELMKKLYIEHRLTTPYHPQVCDQVIN